MIFYYFFQKCKNHFEIKETESKNRSFGRGMTVMTLPTSSYPHYRLLDREENVREWRSVARVQHTTMKIAGKQGYISEGVTMVTYVARMPDTAVPTTLPHPEYSRNPRVKLKLS